MNLNRRSLIRRAVAAVGVAVAAQKFPVAVRAAGFDPLHPFAGIEPTDERPFLLIEGVTFFAGDPAENDPEWLEETPGGLLLRNKRMAIANHMLTLSQDVRLTIRQCDFDEVALTLNNPRGATITHCRFTSAPFPAFHVGWPASETLMLA